MNRTVAQVLRVLTVLAALGVVFMVYRIFAAPDPVERVPPRSQALTVTAALNQPGTGPFDVQGFVFVGAGWDELRLCDARRRGDPPGCIGPFLYISGVTAADFDLEEGQTDAGVIRWSDRVVLTGTVVGTEITVASIEAA